MKKRNYSGTLIKAGGLATLAVALSSLSASAAPWTFGVMADTQWIGSDDGGNPNTVAVGIINQVNQQFIAKGVAFVIQVGDLTDNGATNALDVHALYVQSLYNAGIGFFPLRGNHEGSQAAAKEFVRIWPQTTGGLQNSTPAFPLGTGVDTNVSPVANTGSTFSLGANFSSPTTPAGLTGLTYSFDYNNVRFVLLDQFTRRDGTGSSVNSAMLDQVTWIDSTLKSRPLDTHAIVLGHKGLITPNHVDVLMGANPSSNPDQQNLLLGSFWSNHVHYYLNGHDHVHQNSLVWSTDGVMGSNAVHNLTCASDSSKFYIPASPSNDKKYNVPAFGTSRETCNSQETNTVGYYIFTVDGPRLTIDFYSAVVNPTYSSGEYLIATTPTLTFTKRESTGYSLNGNEYLVPQNASYTVVQDAIAAGSGFLGTSAKILSGVNSLTYKDRDNRQFTNAVNTGWAEASTVAGAVSDVLSLWGLTDVTKPQADTYTLSVSYDPSVSTRLNLYSKNASGNWVSAVSLNNGGAHQYKVGAWSASYPLGTSGFDPATHTAWAVVNHASEFVAGPWVYGDFSQDGKVDVGDLALLQAKILAHTTDLTYDLNGDGKVDVADARWLVLHYTH